MSNIREVSAAELEHYLATAQGSRLVTELILHHTWQPTAAQYHGLSTWSAIRRYHMEARGWSDIGYHLGIGPDGTFWILRPLAKSGAHTLNHNAHSVGVCLVGNFDVEDPWANGLGTACLCLAACCEAYNLGPHNIHFHREFADKTCPGTRIDLTSVRNTVGRILVQDPPTDLKVILLPGSTIVPCHPTMEGDTVRADLRPLAEALAYEVIAEHLASQGKVYLRKRPTA